MLEIELCRICLADSMRMYPIEHTRYHEIFEWYTEDTMDMNDELPYSVCYICNAVLNRLYGFLNNMIHTEIYLKEILRNTSKLTYESVEKLKTEMTSKPHNLSKVWLRSSNFIALDAFKGHRPPRELQRYFDHPPIMIEYHKPYEHMKLEDIPEEQEPEEVNEEEPEEVNEEEPEEAKEAKNEEKMEVESEQIKETETNGINDTESVIIKEAGTEKINETETEEIKEAESKEKVEEDTDLVKESNSGEIKDTESPQQKSNLPENESKSPHQNKDLPKPPQDLRNHPEHGEGEDSENTADQDEFANDDDDNISLTEDMRLVLSSDSENEERNTPNIVIDDEPVIQYHEQSRHKSESKYAKKRTITPDPIDAFLISAKKYRPPEELNKSSNVNVTEEDQTPYLKFTSGATEVKTQKKKVKTPEPVKFHNPYLQFIEERIPTEEKQEEKVVETLKPCLQEKCVATQKNVPKKGLKTPEQRVKTPAPEKYHNQNLQLIDHIPIKATELGQTSKQMEIHKNVHTNTPIKDQQSLTELAAVELEKRYFNLYRGAVKEIPFNISNEPLVIEKLTPVHKGHNKPVSKIIKTNEPAKIIVTSEPKKYIHSYVDFVKGIVYDDEKESNQEIVPIPLKLTKKRKYVRKITRPKIVTKTPVQEKPSEKNLIDGKISGYCYFDHQKRFRRASILRKTRQPIRNTREIEELANKIKNRAAVLRKELQKSDLNAKNVLEENAVTKTAPYNEDQPHGSSYLQEENTSTHLQLKSKEHSDKLLKEIPQKISQDIKKRKLWHVVEYPVQSKHTDSVSDEHKDLNQKGDQMTLKDQEDKKDEMWSDEDENTMDSQVDRALKVLDESLIHEDSDLILQNEDDQEHNMPNDHITNNNDPPLQIIDDCIVIEDDLEDDSEQKDQNNLEDDSAQKDQNNLEDDNEPLYQQDDLTFVVQDVFSLKDKGLEDEDLVPKDQYDQIIMLANQDDQVMEDGNVAVKIESVDENFQVCFEENHENENILSDNENETFDNEDIMDSINGDGIVQHGDFKIQENIKIDEEESQYESYLQERVTKNENTAQSDRDSPANNGNPKFESDYNAIQDLNEQEHYEIRKISEIKLIPTVQLERLPIRLIKKNSTENNRTVNECDKYCCTLCDFKTTVRVLMFRHQNVHDINKQFVCNVCQHRFLSHYHLSRHKVIHDDCTKYYCAYCDFETSEKPSMEKHQNDHRKFNRYPCQWCQKRFRSPSHRSRHKCQKKYLHKCDICNRDFKKESMYLRHLEKHTGDVPTSYKCNICNKSYDSKKEYLNHKKEHKRGDTDKIKYPCKWCRRNFNKKINCYKHMKLHEKNDEKVSLETEDKQKIYETDDEMELLATENEKVDDNFVCGLCSQSFDTEIELGRHAVDHIL